MEIRAALSCYLDQAYKLIFRSKTFYKFLHNHALFQELIVLFDAPQSVVVQLLVLFDAFARWPHVLVVDVARFRLTHVDVSLLPIYVASLLQSLVVTFLLLASVAFVFLTRHDLRLFSVVFPFQSADALDANKN